MIHDFETMTLLGVLEYDGLIRIESGIARTTDRFHTSIAAARRAKRARSNVDLRESISHAMHRLYAKYLTETEMQSLVDAMLPIAEAEPPAPPKTKQLRRQA